MLVCADATAVRRLLADEYVGDTVARQFAAAEVVLVTKTDVALPAENEEAAMACRAAAPQARLILQDPADSDATAAEALAAPSSAADDEDAGVAPQAHHHGGEDHAETHVSSTLELPGPVDVDELARLLASSAIRLVRAKGVVQNSAGAWQEIQLASGRVDVRPRLQERPPPQGPALVVIAAGPDASRLVVDAVKVLESVRSAARILPDGQGPNSPGG